MTEKKKDTGSASLDALIASFDVPVKGSIGLLALGSVGIKAWRKVRREAGVNKSEENQAEKKENNG